MYNKKATHLRYIQNRFGYRIFDGMILSLIIQIFTSFLPAADHKECYQVGSPPGGSNKDCQFNEFCACDFYELSMESNIFKKTIKPLLDNLNGTFNHLTIKTENSGAKTRHKTYCRDGEKGVCLHVCQLSMLKPGSCKSAIFEI